LSCIDPNLDWGVPVAKWTPPTPLSYLIPETTDVPARNLSIRLADKGVREGEIEAYYSIGPRRGVGDSLSPTGQESVIDCTHLAGSGTPRPLQDRG